MKLEEETEEVIAPPVPMQVLSRSTGELPRLMSLRVSREDAEHHAISRALECTGWNRRRAAQLLCISYRGLLYKIRQYKITAATQNPSEQNGAQGQER
jgi:transcriptional regulator with GAF, ATPase, and Fis domain